MSRKKISRVLDLISEEQRDIAKNLVEELIFMQGMLKDLKAEIRNGGVVDTKSGTVKESPAVKSYNQTIQRYGLLLKQLEMMIRKDVAGFEGEDALKSWLEAQK